MGFGRATELKCQLWNAIKGNPAPRLQQKGNSMLEPEMTDLYTKWAAELLDPLRDEVSVLVKENRLLRDMVAMLATSHDEVSAVAGMNAEIEALRRKE